MSFRWVSVKHILFPILSLLSACSPAPIDPYPSSGVDQAQPAAVQAYPAAGEPVQTEYPGPTSALAPLTGPASALVAYSIGLQHAQQEWKPDARLTRLETLQPGNADGLSPVWLMNFHSPTRRLEYLILQVQDGQVAYALQRDSPGPGKPLYTGEWIDSPKAAQAAAPYCEAAGEDTWVYKLDANLQGGIEWLVTCGSGDALHSMRLNAASGEIISSWSGDAGSEP